MKRLLAYLFLVLGLGLVFNVNAKAELYCVAGHVKSLEEIKYFVGFKHYKEKRLFKITQNKRCGGDYFSYWRVSKEEYYLLLDAFRLKKKEYLNTQIAKAEPSQNEEERIKVSPSEVDLGYFKIIKNKPYEGNYKHIINLIFCWSGNSDNNGRPYTYGVYLKSQGCPSNQPVKKNHKWLLRGGISNMCYITNLEKKVKHTSTPCNYKQEGFLVRYDGKNFYFMANRRIQGKSLIAIKKPHVSKEDLAKKEEKERIEKQKRIAEEKKKAEERRIAKEKKKEEEKQRKEQEYRILVKKFGDQCKNNSLGSLEFDKCLNDKKSEEELRVKLEKEYLESLTPEERRAHTCSKTFGFKKGSGNFKDCIFKMYAAELELQKLELEKQLALALVEAEKAKAETAKAQFETVQARAEASKSAGKLQQAQLEATNAQTYMMKQQAAAARKQAAAAEAQAKSNSQQTSLNLMMQGLNMLAGQNQSTAVPRTTTTCRWVGAFFQCN